MSNSYYLYQKYISHDGQNFYPAYPAEYSVDAEGTRQKVLRLQNDPQCGTPEPSAIYRWFELYPNEYVCENYNKYKKLYRQVSYNNGITWATIMPYETMKGDLIASKSTDCGYQGELDRWTWNGIDYICLDCENQQPDVPPTGNIMFSRTLRDGTYFEVKCGESGTTLSKTITNANNYIPGSYNSATAMTIGNCVTEIGESAFEYWNNLVGRLSIPEGVRVIGVNAFRSCTGFDGSLVIPDSVTTIGNAAFDLCSGFNGTLTLGKNLETIGEVAFRDCSGFTVSLVIPDKVTSIGNYAFNGCTGFNGTLTLGKNLQNIGRWAFGNCSGFTNDIVIPATITEIGAGAFEGCSKLSSVSINATTPPFLDARVFDNTNNCPIYVPDESLTLYKARWSTYASRIKPLSEKP